MVFELRSGSQLNKGLSYEIGFLCLNEKCWDHAGVMFR